MYKAIKHKSGSRTKAAIAAMICAAYLLCFAAVGYAAPDNNLVHVDGTVEVEAVEAEILQPYGIDIANSSAAANGNVVNINISGLSCPGAGALVRITSKNTGTLKATLVDISKNTGDVDYIVIDMADVPIGDELDPGEICVWDVAVYWDPARDDLTEVHDSTSFEFVLTYENNEYVELPSGGSADDNPDTGDENNYIVFAIIAAISAVVMISCLIFIIFSKKKKEDDESC